MATKEDKNEKATDKAATPETVRLYVRSVSPKGFRRIGRYFGPDEEPVDVTAEQARILLEADKAGDLRVQTEEAKAQAEGLTRKVTRGARES